MQCGVISSTCVLGHWCLGPFVLLCREQRSGSSAVSRVGVGDAHHEQHWTFLALVQQWRSAGDSVGARVGEQAGLWGSGCVHCCAGTAAAAL